MRYIHTLLLSLLISYSIVGQEWNPTGNNTTTGSVFANNLLINRGLINEIELDSNNNIGLYRVKYSTHSQGLLDISGLGGSTPRFQFKARFDDKLYFRAARDSQTNWDGKGFREVVMIDEEGAINYQNASLNVKDITANNLLINRGIVSAAELDSNNNIGLYRVQYSNHSQGLLDVSGLGGSTPRFQLKAHYDDKLYFRAARDNQTNWDDKGFREVVLINEEGNVGIGTTDTKGFKLGVNGKIAATEVKVALYDNWPDYVFDNEYALPTLKEVENHITEKGHLKDIPSAAEVAENGIMLGNMNAKLLQKIEELTLYTIAQEKEIEELTKKVNKTAFLEEQLLALSKRLQFLESK